MSKYLSTVHGAFQLVSYREGNDGEPFVYFLNEILVNQKNPRQYQIRADQLVKIDDKNPKKVDGS